MVSIGDVCKFTRGLTYKKSDEVEQSNNGVLRANNISLKSRTLDFGEIKYISDNISIPDNKLLKQGSLLICTASGSKKHLGKTAYIDADYDYAFGGFMGLLSPSDDVFGKYLYYVTLSSNYANYIDQLSDGANINNLKFSQLEQFQFTLPPLNEQKRIVEILDSTFASIDKAIENTEKNLANARKLFEEHLRQVFNNQGKGYIEHSLLDVVKLKSGTTVKKGLERETGDIAYLKISGMSIPGNETQVTTSKLFLNEEDIKKANILPKGTTIFPKRGGAIATNKKRITSIPLCIDLNTMGAIPDQKRILPLYVYYFFQTFDLASISNGTTIPQINNYSFDGLLISLPAIDVQNQIIEKIRQLESQTSDLVEIYNKKLDSLKELKQSILQKAFTGQLTADFNKVEEVA